MEHDRGKTINAVGDMWIRVLGELNERAMKKRKYGRQ